MKRFWAKVQIRGDDECWLWVGAKTSYGYGQIWFNSKLCMAHRVAWEMAYGLIPANLCVLHKCDVPACVNHSHLFLGTKMDNTQDMIKKGRMKFEYGKVRVGLGEKHHNAKLTEQDIRDIRTSNLSQSELGRRYGVHQVTISEIRTRKIWRHIE